VRKLERSVQVALKDAGVTAGASLLAAVSGGPDSTALLCALAAVREAVGVTLRACTVDHGIRPASEGAADVAFVLGLCERLSVPCTVAHIEPGECEARARTQGRSLEEVARERRLDLLRSAARDVGARDIALGHTRDDLYETLLMRVFQGSDPDGLRGIAARRGPFVRPLLTCTRSGVLAYLASIAQGWREDPSNRDERFLRNRIRHTLVPALRGAVPGWQTGLLALSRKLGLADDVLREEADRLPWTPESGGFSIDRVSLAGALPAVRVRSLMMLYDRFRPPGSPRRLPWRFLAPALKTILPERIALRGHGVHLASRSGRLSWGPDLARHGKKGYFIEVFEAGVFAAGESGICIGFERSAGGRPVDPGGVAILEENVVPPLILRSRRKGDELDLSDGVTSVKELLDRWGAGGSERDQVPLLADRKGVLAVLGGALGYDSRARAGALADVRGNSPRIIVRINCDAKRDREEGT